MSNDANIGVRIGGDVTPLKTALKQGEVSIGAFTKNARAATNDIIKIGAAATAASAGGLAVMFKTTADAAKELRVLSNISNTTVEQFQKLAFGADAFNISQEKLADILKDTNDRVGDFIATGGGPMADFFDNIAPKVNLTAESFRKLSGPDALQAYYNALEQANLNQQDMTFYMEAMASDATNLIPLLKNNGEGFAQMSREAEQLGIVMSGIDIAQIEAANKSIKNATGIFKAAGQAVSVELAPYVEAVVDQFVEMSKEAGGFDKVAQKGIGGAIKIVGFMADAVHGVKVVFKGLHVVAAGVGTGIITIFNGVIGTVDNLMRSMIDGVNAVTDQLSRLPGVDIDDIGYPEFGKKVNEITQLSVDNLQRLKSEFHELAMQELPSEGVELFLETVKQKASEAAEAVAAVTSSTLQESQSGEQSDQEDPRIKAIKERFLTEEELQRQHNELMLEIGNEFDAKKFDTESQWMEIRAQAIKQHSDKVTQIRESEKLNAINLASSMAGSLMSLAQGHSKKAFEITKKVAVASAVVKGYEAATSAWAAGMATGGPWAPAVAATYTAASLAKTGAQIQAINSQSFSGGGSQGNVGGSSFPSADSAIQGASGGAQSNSGGGAAGSAGSVAINLPAGAIIRGDALLEMIEDSVNNGYNVNFLRA